MAGFWICMIVVWQLSFIHSDLSFRNWYDNVFLAGAKPKTSNKYTDAMEAVSYEFIVPFYAKYFAPWAMFSLLLLRETLVAYVAGVVFVSFVIFTVSLFFIDFFDSESNYSKSKKHEAKQPKYDAELMV